MSNGPVEGVRSGAHPIGGIVDPMKAATHPLKADNDGDAEDRAKLAAIPGKATPSTRPVPPGALDVKA